MSTLGNTLSGVAEAKVLTFVDQKTTPPATTGDPAIYRVGNVMYLRSTDGTVYPLVPGANGAGIKSVTSADSPYAVQATDRTLFVDTTGGAVTLTLPAAGGPALDRTLTIVDAARNFAGASCTIDGNGKNINGASTLVLSKQDGGATIRWSSTAWLSQVSSMIAPTSVGGAQIQPTAMRLLSAFGKNGAGAVTLTGTKVGDKVVGVVNVTDHVSYVIPTDFEATITVVDQIQQVNVGNLSAKVLVFLLLALS